MVESPGQQAFEGLAADAKVTILGAKFDTEEKFNLGESVTLTVRGHIVLVGEEVLESQGTRRVIKIRTDVIQLDSADE